jgi:osmotically-inducible protein OsmY
MFKVEKLKVTKAVAVTALLGVSLSGCLPAFVTGTAVVGQSIVEDRSVGSRVDDNVIELKIRERILQHDSKWLATVSVTVHEGRALLAGTATEAATIETLVELAWKVKGVKEVINEVVVADTGITDFAKDTWIVSAIRSKALLDQDVRSVNYEIRAVNGHVFLLGRAANSSERDKVIAIARNIKGVQKVTSHIVLQK